MAKKKIPNPSKKNTSEKQAFIQAANSNESQDKNLAKGYPISMTPEFVKEIAEFLKEFPEERSRSALMVRATAYYIKLKRSGAIP